MSVEEQPQHPQPPAGGDQVPETQDDRQGDGEAAEATDHPQPAWAARRDLVNHTPRTMGFGDGSQIDGGVFGGTNYGIGGGTFSGDILLGKTEIIYQFGASSSLHASGEIAQSTLEELSARFVPACTDFEALVDRLRDEHVLVLSGPYYAGRRTAALVLLHRVGAHPVRAISRDTTPGQLTAGLGGGEARGGRTGHVLCDLITEPGRPLREADLLAARKELDENAYLVITVGPTALLEDVPVVSWQAPLPGDVLTAHLGMLVTEDDAAELLSLPAVTAFLARSHQPREVADFARILARYAAGEVDAAGLRDFSLAALEDQVQEWFEDDGTVLHLREKAFLVALAAFDEGPYALTAELSDLLYVFLQETENGARFPTVPVFGTHIGKRLQLARARRFEDEEATEWGPVRQVKAAFLDERASLVLLREMWTGHPSARPALVRWLRQLAEDGRPFVRTRAASTVAVLAHTDLPSAMALIIEPWASSSLYRHRLVAVNALTLTHFLGTPNVPRILDAWCESDESALRWVAIRAHGLMGPERPSEALAALRAAARHQAEQSDPDEDLAGQLAEAVELLLLSSAGDDVLAGLLRTLHDDRPAMELALGGFLSACRRTEQDERHGQPLVLSWFARASAARTPAATGIGELWRTALGSRGHTRDALEVLRRWVLSADHDTATEWALAALLPSLVTTSSECRRIGHLLRTMPGEDGTDPPPVAGRLLAVLPHLR
ncbi:hypothetical protein OHU11_18500 [Streptomyces sp. NBC_00257]|uniref:hypothetical protein n=1 Tax=unclassified Streptomyces TaxID=2593676 RepID=UPI00225510EC|nr:MULTISPECIES: hypothetical protein [unclassified Streptomyces]MCX5429666.1 hypothetical protein [Streptomyces sp. NBC_00062]WTB56159.1 hypothetical protein OG832_24915 [Streptomyces sp. NBC_00826]WTH90959.1 hypothetical protein OIC43_18780 [Streptomyces sp. NBC_00825]WTH99685.1 hypothetical protein OHA23_18765 [Streptomyces sp. NBC_00822]